MRRAAVAVVAAAIVGATGWANAAGVDRGGSGSQANRLSVVTYRPGVPYYKSPRAITEALEARYGFTSAFRYRDALPGFAAALSPDVVAKLRSEPDVAAVTPEGHRYVVSYHPNAVRTEVVRKVAVTQRQLRFRRELLYLRGPFTGFSARLSARQIAALERDPSTHAIRPSPFSHFVRGPSPEKANELSRRFGFTASVSDNGFWAELSARQIALLARERSVRYIYPDGAGFYAIDPIELGPVHLVFVTRDASRYRWQLRKAFLRSHPRLSPRRAVGPRGRIYHASYARRQYALATFSLVRPARSHHGAFRRAPGRAWRHVGTDRLVCINTDTPEAPMPAIVVEAWELRCDSRDRLRRAPGIDEGG